MTEAERPWREAARRTFDALEAAMYVGCSRSQLYVEMRAGRIRSFKIGRLRRFTQEALDDYVASQEAAAQSQARSTAA